MKLIKGYYLTSTEKQVIRHLIDNNLSTGRTKLKKFAIVPFGERTYKVKIASKYTATIGDTPKWHLEEVIICLK